MRIVYVVGGLLTPNGMSSVLSSKINYLAEHTDYELYMILTEKAGKKWFYQVNPKVKWINFDLNFDELDTMPFYKKVFCYRIKLRKYKKKFTDYLMEVRPDITISTVRREINFINDIQDGSKKIGEIHFNRFNYRDFRKSWLPDSVNRYVARKWMDSLLKQLKRLDKFVVLSDEDYQNWPELTNKTVIPNFLSFFPDFQSTCDNKLVIAVGRYTWVKGFDMLLQAWKKVYDKHPDWTLNIFGSGERDSYVRQAQELGIAEVVNCNPATSNIYEKYRESSIFAFSSRFEGFGLVLAEAMSTGVPAVSFASPCGPLAIISDKIDGLLVEKENVEQFAEALCYLIENPLIRKEYGQKAIVKAQQFSEDMIMKKWIDLFQSFS